MPNWCNNTISIEGPADKIKALWDKAQSTEDGFLLEAMVPIGEWDYDNAVSAWGTKWDLNGEGLEFVDLGNGRAAIQGYADSAWSPPIEAFETYCNANSDVNAEIRYFEPGMSFIGVWSSTDGDQYWEDIGSLLDADPVADSVLFGLLDDFNAWEWFDEEDENLEIDLDGGVSAINED